MTEAKPSLKRTLIGRVVSDKRTKTVTVLVERRDAPHLRQDRQFQQDTMLT